MSEEFKSFIQGAWLNTSGPITAFVRSPKLMREAETAHLKLVMPGITVAEAEKIRGWQGTSMSHDPQPPSASQHCPPYLSLTTNCYVKVETHLTSGYVSRVSIRSRRWFLKAIITKLQTNYWTPSSIGCPICITSMHLCVYFLVL